MSFLSHARAQNADVVARARSLRLHCHDVLQRAGLLRHRADRLLAVSSDLRIRVEAQRTTGRRLGSGYLAAPVADVGVSGELAWYRAQVREMLDAGWSREELADVGVTDALLADLGLERPC